MTAKKTKLFIITAAVLSIVLICYYGLLRLCHSIKSYAETAQAREELALDTDTFLDMRSGLIGKYKNDPDFDAEEFSDWEFQHDEGNFTHICSETVNGLLDKRHGVTLGEESEAIQLNRNKVKDVDPLGEIVGPKITETSALTVFTYGQGARLSHWSNRGRNTREIASQKEIERYYNTFWYQKDSMIEVLRRESDADVYIAKTNQIYYDKSVVDRSADETYAEGAAPKFTVNYQDEEGTQKEYTDSVVLFRLEPSTESYSCATTWEDLIEKGRTSKIIQKEIDALDEERDKEKLIELRKELKDVQEAEQLTLTDVQDFSKHNIILFDSDAPYQYHNYVYNELNIILTQISYDYLLTVGEAPKVSMISHSTGGKWNMMWANKHPLNVDKLYAVAAPFNGTAMGHFLYFDWDKLSSMLPDDLASFRNSVTNPSGIDNVDKELYNELNDDWEFAVKVNPELYCFAVTALTSADLLVTMLDELVGLPDILVNFLIESTIMQIVQIAMQIINLIAGMINNGLVAVASVFLGPLGGTVTAVALSAFLIAAEISIATYITYLCTVYTENLVSYVLNSIIIDKNGEMALQDDIIVDYNSALGYASEFDDLGHRHYSNFIRYEKTMRPDNTDLKKMNLKQFPAPHNLEVQDEDIIDDICADITQGKPETRYNYTVTEDDTVRIDGIKEGFYEEKIIFPDYIDGKKVTQIGEGVLRNNKTVEYVKIGKYVENIEDSAFEGAAALEEIDFGDNGALLKIGDRALQSSGIKSIEIPSTVEFLGDHVFAYSKMEDVTIADEDVALRSVGENILKGTPYLENAKGNIVFGKVLVKYNDRNPAFVPDATSIEYFASKCFEGSNLETIDISRYKFKDDTLPDYFLYGAAKLRQVVLPDSLIIIGVSAFENTASLRSVTLPQRVELIGSRAFARSGIAELNAESGYPPIISDDTFEGVGGLKVYVKYYAIDEFRTNWAIGAEFDSHKRLLNFYDGGDLVFSGGYSYYFDYLNGHEWMVDGNYKKAGYRFLGWYDGNGKRYYNGSLSEFELGDAATVWKLYARWDTETYYVWYDERGGSSSNPFEVTVNDKYLLQPSYREGYEFLGWFTSADCRAGDEIYELSNISADIKLYAGFVPLTAKIVYDATDITVKRTEDTVTYGERFKAPIPEKEGYAFAGWYTTADDSAEKGVRITGTNGVSLNYCKYYSETVTLYARWTRKSFVINYVDGIHSFVLGGSGLTAEAGSVMAGQAVDINNPEFRALFAREGYIFENFVDENGIVRDFTDGVPDLGANFSTFTITPRMIAEEYVLSLFDENGNPYGTIKVTYDDEYDFTRLGISKLGYDLVGWRDGSGRMVLDSSVGYMTTDLTPDEENNGSADLYAVWEASVGNITFDPQGGKRVVLTNDYSAVYNQPLPCIDAPTRDGYTFDGFYDEVGTKYIDAFGYGVRIWDKPDPFVTLYAHWTAKEYSLTYHYNDYEGTAYAVKFTAADPIVFPTSGMEKAGYTFVGWYDAQVNGTALKSTGGIFEDLHIYAHWTMNTFAIVNNKEITVNKDNSTVNLGNMNTSYNTHIITLSSAVTKVLLCGKTSKKIALIVEAASIDIYLNDAKFTSPSGRVAIKASGTMYIHAYGESEIVGADGSVGSRGSKGSNGTDHGAPTNGVTKASDGKVGDDGSVGASGQSALEAECIRVCGDTSNAALSLVGGDGGNGGSGGTGGKGAYGNDGETGGGKKHGVSGGNGGKGGVGGKGGDGAAAVNCITFSNSISQLKLIGGNGGKGGVGGQGGDGGDGGKGANNTAFLSIIGGNYAGDGGHGGDSGSGGKGGDGGNGSKAICAQVIEHNASTETEIDGTGGAGGAGGVFGIVGIGGKGGDGVFGGKKGKIGSYGTRGEAGNVGSDA